MVIIPPDNPRYQVKFEPLVIPKLTNEEALAKGISKVERTRAWSDVNNQPGIKSLLGETNGLQIEEILTHPGSRVVEIGAGKLDSSQELALQNPDSSIIAIDPFIEPLDLLGKSRNIIPIAKRIEDITSIDIPDGSVDGVFSAGHTWNYIEDKLAFIRNVWRMLKDGGRGFIEYMGSPMQPSIEQIIKQFRLEQVLRLSTSGEGINVIEIVKKGTGLLNFGEYTYATSLGGNFSGDVNTVYEFDKVK